jgi:hypothetical protein
MKKKTATTLAPAICSLVLTACSIGGMAGPFPGVPELTSGSGYTRYRGPVAPPQVAYRIDENRYFEIVPNGAAACADAAIQYVDKARGIRSDVLSLRALGGVDIVIDAANDQYLVAPISRGNTDCSSGGGGCGGSTLPYSTDAGRTWKRTSPAASGGHAVYMSGENVYTSGMRAKISEFSLGYGSWKDGLLSEFPKPHKAPLDTKFHCTANGKE